MTKQQPLGIRGNYLTGWRSNELYLPNSHRFWQVVSSLHYCSQGLVLGHSDGNPCFSTWILHLCESQHCILLYNSCRLKGEQNSIMRNLGETFMQYFGGCLILKRNIISDVGDTSSSLEVVQYCGGYHQYCGGYHQYCGWRRNQDWLFFFFFLNILHSTEHSPQYWTFSAVPDILHSTEHPPHTVLNMLHSTGHPLQ